MAGSGAAAPADLDAAERAGRALGERGAVVVTGGLGGVMEAACRGAKAAGGQTLGILPGLDRSEANAFVDLAIATGLGEGRNILVVRACDALIAVGGEWGTLSEIALAMRAGRRVIGLDTWELSKRGRPVDGIVAASSPEEAAELALA